MHSKACTLHIVLGPGCLKVTKSFFSLSAASGLYGCLWAHFHIVQHLQWPCEQNPPPPRRWGRWCCPPADTPPCEERGPLHELTVDEARTKIATLARFKGDEMSHYPSSTSRSCSPTVERSYFQTISPFFCWYSASAACPRMTPWCSATIRFIVTLETCKTKFF